jgi:hypothetical protein
MPENQRNCGTCTACCKTHPVQEIDKPAGAWCPHCNIGRGCRIYDDRPPSCRDFTCQWLKGTGEDDDRPDKSKLVIDFIQNPDVGDVVALFEVMPGGLSKRLATTIRKAAFAKRYAVLAIPIYGDACLSVSRNQAAPTHVVLENGKTVRVERV